jgi:hypothetical protein
MPRYNELQDIVTALVAEKKALSKDADKANAVQYGTVRFNSRAEARRHWEKLPRAQKREHIQKNGTQAVIQMLRGNSAGGNT